MQIDHDCDAVLLRMRVSVTVSDRNGKSGPIRDRSTAEAILTILRNKSEFAGDTDLIKAIIRHNHRLRDMSSLQ